MGRRCGLSAWWWDSRRAAPVFRADGEILGSVIAVLSVQRLGITDLDRLVGLVKSGGQRISDAVGQIGRPLLRQPAVEEVGV